MKKISNSGLIVLNKSELDQLKAGGDAWCAAIGGAAIASGFTGNAPAFFVFGAIYLATCVSGH